MEGIKLLLPKEAVQVNVSTRSDSKQSNGGIAVLFEGCIWRKQRDTWYFSYNGNHEARLLHRAIYEKYYGEIPAGMVIHHKNGVFDNRPESLEALTREEHLKEHNTAARIKKHWEEGSFKAEGLICRVCGKTFTGNIKLSPNTI